MVFVAGILIGNLHDTDIGIRHRIVLNYPLVISPTAEHLTVARVRERFVVEDSHLAVLQTVANQITILRDMAPGERHQGLPPRFRGGPPICLLGRLGIRDEMGIIDQSGIGSGKDFLPSKAIKGYHDHFRIIVGFGARSHQGTDAQ